MAIKPRVPSTAPQALALAVSHALLATNALAATITVTSTTDDNIGCTLREAVVSANADLAAGGCQAGNGADTIVFDATLLPATITLQSNPITISSAVTVQGPGPDQLTVSGANTIQLLQVTDGNAGIAQAVEINGIGLSYGSVGQVISPGVFAYGNGGAILNAEALTVSNCSFENNRALGLGGAIYSGLGSLTVVGSTFNRNIAYGPGTQPAHGGAIAARSPLVLDRSLLQGNGAYDTGGAVFASNTVQITASTFADNGAGIAGGAVYSTGDLSILNNTLRGNYANAAGAIASYDPFATKTVSLAHNTISGNSSTQVSSAAVYLIGRAELVNNIIAASAGADCNATTTTLNANNWVEDGSCAPTFTGDPRLDPLQNNGGPTPTQALQPESQAIDAAVANCALLDQRGLSRASGPCDLGATESSAPKPATFVTTLDDTIDPNDGLCSLREAIEGANDNRPSSLTLGECVGGFGDDVIQFDPSLNPGTITLDGSELLVDDSVTIQGPADRGIAISADDASRIFRLQDANVTLDRLTLRNGYAAADNSSGYGGAIFNFADLTLSNSYLTNNAAQVGGAIYSGRDLTVYKTTIANNFAQFTGAGIRARGGVAYVANSTLYNNYAEGSGGGISSYGADLELRHVTLASNGGASGGDAIAQTTGGSIVMSNSLLAAPDNSLCELEEPLSTSIGNWVEDGGCAGDFSGDPGLGPLQDNGGIIPSMALLAGSGAIDSGSSGFCLTTDQRDYPRDADCDIGAIEFGAPPPDEIFSDGFE